MTTQHSQRLGVIGLGALMVAIWRARTTTQAVPSNCVRTHLPTEFEVPDRRSMQRARRWSGGRIGLVVGSSIAVLSGTC
jgi:hypothetical protein